MNFKNFSLALMVLGCFSANFTVVQAKTVKTEPMVTSKAVKPNAANDKNMVATPKTVEKKQPIATKNEKQSKKHKKDKIGEKVQQPAKPSFNGIELPENYKKISIFGDPVAMKAQAVSYIRKNNPKVKLSCTVEVLVNLYWQEAKREGVRPDLALCQALVETGFFKYGGDVVYQQNNFCGLGTVGKGVKGASFKTPQIGVRAHIQHLLAYSEIKRPSTPIVDPRYELAHNIRVQKGVVDTWSGLNGTWAMGSNYCEKIMVKYQEMLKMPGARVVLPPVDPIDKYKTDIKVRIGHIINDNKE